MTSGGTGRRNTSAGPLPQGACVTEYTDVAAASDVRAFHRQWLSGVTIITTMVDGRPRGMALNAFASVSLEPPVVLACIAKSAATYQPLLRSGHFAMNLLSADQSEVAARFARSGSSEKFEGLSWRVGRFGSPVIEESCAHLEAAVESRVDAYTHTVLFGRVLAASSSALSPMGYLAGKIFDPRDSAQWQGVITALAPEPGETG
jgi:flavin reductase (DIM6/NTAB) family NADH-FMN oxidoreductase RutF